jgi:hypothetical protein
MLDTVFVLLLVRLVPGDVVRRINGEPTRSKKEFYAALKGRHLPFTLFLYRVELVIGLI